MTPSARAEQWTRDVGIDFHEVHIEANANHIILSVSDLIVTKLSDDLEDISEEKPIWASRYWMRPVHE